MQPFGMDELIEQHIAVETAGDPLASVAMYVDDVEHDVVWEFRDGLMSLENIWLDGASIVAQFTASDYS